MTLKIHRSDHPDLLVDALCDVIQTPLADAFAPEIVAVPTRGIDRWLTERIGTTFAHRGVGDGIAANIDFPFPSRVVAGILDQIPETARSAEAWSTRTVIAHLERIIDDHHDESWMWLIARFVDGPEGDGAGAQRLRAAQKIARLFSSYARYRPQMVRSWADGDDVGPDGTPISDIAAWQPRLWRLLRDRIGVPPMFTTLPDALATIRSGTGIDLPERLSVYGVTAFDPLDRAVLEALGHATAVHLFILHPSPATWSEAAPIVAAIPPGRSPIRRADDPIRDTAHHPLLGSWGRESRELQIVLGPRDPGDEDVRESDDTDRRTLLGALQTDIRADLQPSIRPDGADRSIQIHACYGPQRQVQVLRDAVLHLLKADPTLEPRDIVIMTPDLATYAPLIEATFPAWSDERGSLPDLRVRIADRAPTRTNPLLGFAAAVIDLAGSRISRGDVTQLLGLPEVQRRLRIDPDTAAEIGGLVDDGNIRWGLDADHRERNGAGRRDEHTWDRGTKRILAGVFFDDDPIRVVDDIAPLSHVEGGSAGAAGKLAIFLERIDTITRMLDTPAATSDWAERVGVAVRLLAEPEWGDEWQWAQLDRLLAETFPVEGADTPDPMIGRDEAAVLIAPWTEDRPGRLHHRTGDVTVCTLAPMRSVPYRIVCLLGMENDRFPRSGRSDGDDLLADDEAVGDRDRSAEDRQLLLDALMAAGDNFIVTYTGRDPLTNAPYPPAVPIAEMEETIAAMIGTEEADRITTLHPLQPFNPEVFIDGKLGVDGPWGFDPIQYAGAAALIGRDGEEESTGAARLAAAEPEYPTLDRLIAYLKAPSATFLRRSLALFIPGMDDAGDDELPTALGGLERWSVTQRFLSGLAAGHDVDRLVRHERAADTLPAGDLATGPLGDSLDLADRIREAAAAHGCIGDRFVPVTGTVTLGSGSVGGSVLADPEEARVCDVSPSRVKPSRLLALYARVVFLTAFDPERAWRGTLIGNGDKEGTTAIVTIGPLGDDAANRAIEATRKLTDLVDLYIEGMESPMPLFPEASFVWATTDPADRTYRTGQVWEPDWKGEGGEREDPAHRMLFPDLETAQDLADSDFPACAERLWTPILGTVNEAAR